jgi:hypothetical protein
MGFQEHLLNKLTAMKRAFILAAILFPILSFAQLKEFGWLAGTWKIKNKAVYEVWKKGIDSKMMEGISYRINGADTLIGEALKIKQQDATFFYVPDVAGDQPEVYFKIITFDATGFIAENSQHDFPKIIRYRLLSPVSMNAEIEGDGKIIPFVFDKIK